MKLLFWYLSNLNKNKFLESSEHARAIAFVNLCDAAILIENVAGFTSSGKTLLDLLRKEDDSWRGKLSQLAKFGGNDENALVFYRRGMRSIEVDRVQTIGLRGTRISGDRNSGDDPARGVICSFSNGLSVCGIHFVKPTFGVADLSAVEQGLHGQQVHFGVGGWDLRPPETEQAGNDPANAWRWMGPATQTTFDKHGRTWKYFDWTLLNRDMLRDPKQDPTTVITSSAIPAWMHRPEQAVEISDRLPLLVEIDDVGAFRT